MPKNFILAQCSISILSGNIVNPFLLNDVCRGYRNGTSGYNAFSDAFRGIEIKYWVK